MMVSWSIERGVDGKGAVLNNGVVCMVLECSIPK